MIDFIIIQLFFQDIVLRICNFNDFTIYIVIGEVGSRNGENENVNYKTAQIK